MAEKTNRKMSRLELIKTHALLEKVIVKMDGGLVRYEDGWSDERVGEEIGVTKRNVQGARTELFGNLQPAARGSADPAELAVVRSAITRLSDQYAELVLKYNDLVATLALNKVAPVKHLAVQLGSQEKKS